MANYEYIARSANGEKITGVVTAQDQETALTSLSTQKLVVIEIKEQTVSAGLDTSIDFSFLSRVTAEDISTFLMQLSIMVKCGVSLSEAISSLENGETKPKFKKILNDVRTQIFNGKSFSEALNTHPECFDKFMTSMIKIGETGGVLEQVLLKLSAGSKRGMALRNQILGALAYPSVLITVATIVLVVLIVYAIPQFATMFAKGGLELPLATKMLIAVGEFARTYFLQIAIVMLIAFISLIAYLFTSAGRSLATELSLYIPVLKTVTQRYFVVQVAESMGLLLGAGVPLRELLIAIQATMTAPTPRKEISNMLESIGKGGTLSQALSESRIFPAMAVKLIETGETTGALDTMFGEIAVYYDDQLQTAIKSALSMLEPLLITAMATIVGFIMLAVFIPLFKMSFIRPK